LGATAFFFLIQLVTDTLLGGLTGFYPPNPIGEPPSPVSVHPNFVLVPLSTAIGGLIVGFLVYRFAPEAEGHGTDSAIEAFHRKDGVIRRRVPIVKTIASAFTIGSGGSGGREGPTAQIAAGFGSFVADMFRLPARDRRIAVAAGIGAGIGSIFKSPFGGAILSGEILYSGGDFEAEALIPAFVASPIGYVIFSIFTGFTPIFGNSVHYTFTQPRNLLIYALLGLICGLVGRLYTFSFYYFKRLFESFRFSRYLKPMVGAAIAGIIGVFFPEVLGLGYGFTQFLVNGDLRAITTNYFTIPLLVTFVLLVLLKIFATSVTVGSGGSAGVFAPSLVIGSFVGATLWEVVNYVLRGWIPIPAPLVIVGMMALFAGVGRVPIAVILMVSEMTGTLTLLAPSMVAVVISYYVTGPKYTIYRSQVLNRASSPAHTGEYSVPLLTRISVVDAMNTNVVWMSPEDTVENAYQTMLNKGFRGIPVVASEKVVGIVTLSDLIKIPREQMKTTPLEQVMTKNVLVTYPNDTLLDVLNKMMTHGVGRLPVVSKESGRLMGIITRTDVVKTYDRIIENTSRADSFTQNQERPTLS
jgi:CIC family chloride channel protein